MDTITLLSRILAPPDLDDEERHRIARTLHAFLVATLIGLTILLTQRLITGELEVAPPLVTATCVVIISLVLVYRGLLMLAASLFLWTILALVMYLAWRYDGTRDTVLFAIPGALVVAGLVLSRRYFLFFTAIALFLIGVMGYLEATGVTLHVIRQQTDFLDIIDLIVILGVTAFTIRLLGDNLIKSLARSREDATEIRKQTGRLKASEERYRALFEGANDAIFIMDDQRFLQCNTMALRMFGCQVAEDMTGHSPWEFSPAVQPDGRDSVEKAHDVIRRALEGEPQRFYWKHTRKDGTSFDGEVSLNALSYGEGKFIQAMVRDITERKSAEGALRESEERFARLSEAAFEGIVINDEGIVLDCNRQLAAMFDYEPSQMVGMKVMQFVAPESVDFVARHIGSRSEEPVEAVAMRKDGSTFPVEARARTFHFKGRPIRVAAIRDITGRKKAEDERKKLEMHLFQAQKVESIGTLAAGIAHDFNNILAIIMGNNSLLEKEIDGHEQSARRVRTIRSATERGAQLVQQLLTFARKTNIKPCPVPMNDLLRESAKLLEGTFPKTIEIGLRLRQDLPFIVGDQNQLHQVVVNLCVNARDAMPNGGTLVLLTDIVSGALVQKKFPNAFAQRYVMISVKDSGTGMSEETRRRIFDPFFTTKEPGKGTGLGLAVVLGIVEGHDGFVEVESILEKGTEFKVYLPAIEEAREIVVPVDGTLTSVRGGEETILFIEDEEMIREIVVDFLHSKGYSVITAIDGEEGVGIYQRQWRDISLILSDYGLPKYNGEQVYRLIKGINPDALFVLQTGFIEPEMRAALLKGGITDILEKPFSPIVLLAKVREALDSKPM